MQTGDDSQREAEAETEVDGGADEVDDGSEW